jgi:hypothetical protein
MLIYVTKALGQESTVDGARFSRRRLPERTPYGEMRMSRAAWVRIIRPESDVHHR